MFGYVRVYPPELKVREYETYRAAYCGLCRAQGHCTGFCSRLTLNYDFVFLAVFRMALAGQSGCFTGRRCAVHPLSPRPMMEENEELRYAARAAALLTSLKNEDDRADDRGLRRARALCLTPPLAVGCRRAEKTLGDLKDLLAARLAAYGAEEKSTGQTPSADRPAHLFGEVLAPVFSYGLTGDSARIASSVGHTLGHWITLIDAADDWEDDLRHGRYNPLAALWGGKRPGEEARRGILGALDADRILLGEALDLLSDAPPDLMAILRNVAGPGMAKTEARVLLGAKEKLEFSQLFSKI